MFNNSVCLFILWLSKYIDLKLQLVMVILSMACLELLALSRLLNAFAFVSFER